MEPTPTLNLLHMIQEGWLATYPLILLSIVSLTVIAERLWTFRGLVRQTRGTSRPTACQALGSALNSNRTYSAV